MANTLKFGNGEWYGKKDTILAYNDENNNYKPLPFDFSRASSATVINKDGLIETVGSGEPRVDYKDDTNGALLLEPSRTNFITYSEDFSQSAWNKQSGISATYNTTETLSPDGTYNATKLTGNGSTGIYHSVSVSGVVCRSIYIKSVTGNTNVTLKDPQNTITQKTLNITPKWQRFELVEDNTIGSQGLWVDDIPSSGIYIYGAQIEQGSYATSYIPTQGSAVTRLADSCNQTPPDGVIGQTEGTLYGEFDFKEHSTGTRRLLCLTDGSSSNRITTYINALDKLSLYIVNGGVAQADIQATILTEGTIKYALAYANNSIKLYLNGTQVGTDTSATIPATSDFLVGFEHSGSPSYFNWRNCQLYNTALTDQELQALTTI